MTINSILEEIINLSKNILQLQMISTQLKNVVREMLANPHVDLTRKIRILWRPELYSIQQKYHLPEYKQVSGAGESNLQFLLTSDTGFLFYSIPYSFRSFS